MDYGSIRLLERKQEALRILKKKFSDKVYKLNNCKNKNDYEKLFIETRELYKSILLLEIDILNLNKRIYSINGGRE